MKYIFYLLFIFLYACNPYKKAVKTIQESATIKYDTIKKIDTIFINGKKYDTIFVTKKYYDTLIFNNKYLFIKILKYQDTLKLYSEIKKDTIIIQNNIPYQKYYTEYKENNNTFEKILYWLLIFSLIAIIILIRIKK